MGISYQVCYNKCAFTIKEDVNGKYLNILFNYSFDPRTRFRRNGFQGYADTNQVLYIDPLDDPIASRIYYYPEDSPNFKPTTPKPTTKPTGIIAPTASPTFRPTDWNMFASFDQPDLSKYSNLKGLEVVFRTPNNNYFNSYNINPDGLYG